MLLTWLHVSDIHFGSPDESFWREEALDALLTKINATRSDGWAPDLIFCTGDIAFSGNRTEYKEAEKFFDKLLAATRLEKERLFIVPGNHDVDRDKAKGQSRVRVTSAPDSDEFFAPGRLNAFLQKFQGFQSFLREYLGRQFDDTNYYFLDVVKINQKEVGAIRVGIAGLNTAWLSGKGDREGRMLMGRLPLREALSTLKDPTIDVKVVMFHHPLEWLREFERDVIRNDLTEIADVVLMGHLDEPNLATLQGGENKRVAFLRIGPTHKDSHFPNRAYLARYYTEAGRKRLAINPFRYMPADLMWDTDTEVTATLKRLYKSDELDLGPTLVATSNKRPDKSSKLISDAQETVATIAKRLMAHVEDEVTKELTSADIALVVSALFAYGQGASREYEICAKATQWVATAYDSGMIQRLPLETRAELLAYLTLAMSTGLHTLDDMTRRITAALSELRKTVESLSGTSDQTASSLSFGLWAMVEAGYIEKDFIAKLANRFRKALDTRQGILSVGGKSSSYCTSFALLADSCYSNKLGVQHASFVPQAIQYLRDMHVQSEGEKESQDENHCSVSTTGVGIIALLYAGVEPFDPVNEENVRWLVQLEKNGQLGPTYRPTGMPETGRREIYASAYALLALRLWLRATLSGTNIAALRIALEHVAGHKGSPLLQIDASDLRCLHDIAGAEKQT